MHRLVRLGVVALFWTSIIAVSLAQTTSFEEGNALFKEGKFKEAETAYNRSLAKDGDSPATRYNLGKVQEALADPARAMLEWERALRLNPDYVAARKALNASRETMHSKVAPETWWNKIEPSSWLHHERWVTAIGLWIFIACLVLGFTTKRRLTLFVYSALGALLSLLGFAWALHARAEADMALVLERSIVFRAAPATPARSCRPDARAIAGQLFALALRRLHRQVGAAHRIHPLLHRSGLARARGLGG